ncbi:MAG: carboxymuconolactone decarboxylase family protein [Gammaproteobacteria bacterium]|nr:carboxymuconolactone decarboxylase family protein [Gammaproteobacteria bacterium]
MTRLPRIVPGTCEATAAIEARLIANRGSVSPLYQVLLHSVPVADGWEYFLTRLRQQLGLAPRLRELVILRIAVLNAAPYEFNAHRDHALAAGLSASEVDALANDLRQSFTGTDSLVLDYTDLVTRNENIDDDIHAALAIAFAPAQIVELTALIAAYNMVSRVLRALDIEG